MRRGSFAALMTILILAAVGCGENVAPEESLPLEIPATTLAKAIEGSAYGAAVTGAGGSGRGISWTISAGALPSGLSLSNTNAATVLIEGTPTTAGTFSFTLRVEDSSGMSATRPFSIMVSEALTVLASPVPDAHPNIAYSLPIAASGGSEAGYAWSIVSGSVPAGFTLAPTGTPGTTISGTTTTSGTFAFTVEVTDNAGGTASRPFVLTVTEPLDIQTPTLAVALEGVAYSATVTGIGGAGTGYTWSITTGGLPSGLTLATSGTPSSTISGVPAEAGTYHFTVQVSDASGATATRDLVLIVNGALEIATTALSSGVSGTAYAAEIVATGGSGAGYTWQVVSGALPSGMIMSTAGTPSTTISGTPTMTGSFNFTIQVTDSFGGTATQAFTLAVDPQ